MEDNDMIGTEDTVEILDDLLAEWSQAHRLREATSTAIRESLMQRILAEQTRESTPVTPKELSPLWWRRLFEQSTSVMVPQSADFWSRLSITPMVALSAR